MALHHKKRINSSGLTIIASWKPHFIAKYGLQFIILQVNQLDITTDLLHIFTLT